MNVVAEESKNKIKMDIPKLYFEIGRAEGDLNKDASPDLALAIAECDGENGNCQKYTMDNPPKAELKIYLTEGDKHDLNLVATSKTMICFQCGGAKGEHHHCGGEG